MCDINHSLIQNIKSVEVFFIITGKRKVDYHTEFTAV